MANNYLSILRSEVFNKISNYLVEQTIQMVNEKGATEIGLPHHENEIRNVLIEEYLRANKKSSNMDNFRFESEAPENYTSNSVYEGRVDIKIILKDDFENEKAYFIVECKRLDGTNNLNQKYVNEGIIRFISKKYSSHYNQNFMLGFAVKNIDLIFNSTKIESIQNESPNVQLHGDFKIIDTKSESAQIDCTYIETDNRLVLRHIFVDISNAIKRQY